MKTKFKITAILIFMLAIGAGKTVLAVEKSKTVQQIVVG